MGSRASPAEKYKIIQQMTLRDNNFLNVTWLCKYVCVSRSGYYRWLKAAEARAAQDEQDKKDFEVILAAYTFRGYDKGVRGFICDCCTRESV